MRLENRFSKNKKLLEKFVKYSNAIEYYPLRNTFILFELKNNCAIVDKHFTTYSLLFSNKTILDHQTNTNLKKNLNRKFYFI